MAAWLQVLMNETMTQELPEGLEKYWVDESLYHDINSDEMQSPMSDVFGYSSLTEVRKWCDKIRTKNLYCLIFDQVQDS